MEGIWILNFPPILSYVLHAPEGASYQLNSASLVEPLPLQPDPLLLVVELVKSSRVLAIKKPQ